MLTYLATQRGALKMPDFVDAHDVTTIQVLWAPPQYQLNKIYEEGQVVAPVVSNGYYYTCVANGLTDAVLFPTFANVQIGSGLALFDPKPWDWWLAPGESLVTSVWLDTDNVGLTFLSTVTDAIATHVQVDALPAGLTQFNLTNQVKRANGDILNRSLNFKVAKQ